MSLIEIFKPRPKIPEMVSKEIDKVNAVFPSYQNIKEVRLFGSAVNGCWNPEKSDIDLFILIRGNNIEWSAYNRVIVGYMIDEEGDGSIPVYGTTACRQEFINKLKEVSPRSSVHLATEEDMRKFERIDGVPSRNILEHVAIGFHHAMLKGKLIYKNTMGGKLVN